jgi:hypothetical protein
VRGDPADWKFGWRLEDLEQRIMSQRDVLEAEAKVLDKASPGLLQRIASHTWHHQRVQQNDVLGLEGDSSYKSGIYRDPTKQRLASDLFKASLLFVLELNVWQ